MFSFLLQQISVATEDMQGHRNVKTTTYQRPEEKGKDGWNVSYIYSHCYCHYQSIMIIAICNPHVVQLPIYCTCWRCTLSELTAFVYMFTSHQCLFIGAYYYYHYYYTYYRSKLLLLYSPLQDCYYQSTSLQIARFYTCVRLTPGIWHIIIIFSQEVYLFLGIDLNDKFSRFNNQLL